MKHTLLRCTFAGALLILAHHQSKAQAETQNTNSAAGVFWRVAGNGGTNASTHFAGTTDAVDFVVRTTNTERMRVTAAGNLGIGITAPANGVDITNAARSGTHATGRPLYVTGNISAGSNGIEFRHINGTQGIGIGFNTIYATGTNAAQDLGLASLTTGNLNFTTNGSQRMIILGSNGNVGMGTTTPGYRLDLANGTFAFGSSNVRTETRDNAGLQGNAGAQSGFFETSNPSNYPSGASSWWHLIDTRHSNNTNNYAMQISGSFFDQRIYFRKTNSLATTAWSEFLTTSNINTNAWSITGNSGTTASTNFIGTTDGIDFVMRTSNAERARITTAGSFGIGITAPTQRLDVQGGNARINNAFVGDVGHGAGWGGISHSSQNNTTGYALIESSDGAYTLINKQNTGSGYLGFRVGNSDMAVILNNGNMGIGTTGPSYKLDVFGNGGWNIDVRTNGRYWSNSTDGGMWLSDLQDCFMGNISSTQFGFWSNVVGWAALNITKSNGYVGIGTTAPSARLHVVNDGDNIPVIYGVNTNASSGTTSYGVRGDCGSIGLGSAGVFGLSTNSGQNEIGVLGDYGLWGTGVFGMGWASAFWHMPSTRDFGVFGTATYPTATGVAGYDGSNSAGSYAFYGWGKFAVTGAKAASVPTTQGNQLLYCTESPEIWFEDFGTAQLSNGSIHVDLDEMFQQTVFIDASHPMHVFIQEMGNSNGLYYTADASGKGFTVHEKNNGSSNTAFSYRIVAKRRFYQDHRFGVDAMQPFEDNLAKANYVAPITTNAAEMKQWVDEQTRLKNELAKKPKQ